VHAETGDVIDAGTLLVEVDKRTPSNRLAEVEAALVAAQARRKIAETQMDRARKLTETGTLTQPELEQTELEFANAKAQVVSAEVAVENARIALEDTEVRAPITGTIIEKTVEPGMVITSPTNAVSEGTVLMQMADLNSVQIRALVDETDIGKIEVGLPTSVTVAAYPNQPFYGEVLKIEPQAVQESNVTMFAVLIRIENRNGLLRPGMNADVRVRVAGLDAVTAVPTAALRTEGDIAAVAAMLGRSEAEFHSMIMGEELRADDDYGDMIEVSGRLYELPEGVSGERIKALMQKNQDGLMLTEEERNYLRPVLRLVLADGRFEPPQGEEDDGAPLGHYQFGGNYWVLLVRDDVITPVWIETGLTDLEYTEVVSGLEVGDRVLLLPSASLYEQQTRLREYLNERFSSTPFQQGGRNRRYR
jgi:HlyD family secretion protein